MNDRVDNSGLVGEGENITFDDDGQVKQLPPALAKRISEYVKWADIEKAYEFLHDQDEHESLIIVGTETKPAPHNDIAVAIEKAHNDVNIMVACKVFNTDTDEYLNEGKILTIKIPRDELNSVVKTTE